MLKKVAAKRTGQRTTKPADMEMGQKLRLCRVAKHMSQDQLGKKLGVSFQQIQKYEKGVNRIGAARIQEIAAALEVPVSTFLPSDAPQSKAMAAMVEAMGKPDVQQIVGYYMAFPEDMRFEVRNFLRKLAEKLGD